MSAEEVLATAMKADSDLTAKVKSNLYPDFVRQGKLMPSIAYERQGTEFLNTIHGPRRESIATFEVVVMASTRTESIQVGALFEQAMVRAKLYVTGLGSGFDGEKEIYYRAYTVTVPMLDQ